MIKFLNPSYVFKISGKLLNIFKTILIPLVIIGLVFSLFLSPEDYIQGDSVRIMYIHVPAAWISLFSFAAISFFCILNFLFKLKNVTLIYKSLAPIGLTFNIVAVVTGSLGSANLGYLVGLGRKTHIYVSFNVFLHSIHFFIQICK